jgi:pyrimidine-nucleoside phosphorylase
MRAVDLIAAKRSGLRHTAREVTWLVTEFTAGRIPDYQMAAWLMAVCSQGLDDPELGALTTAMVASGEFVDLSAVGPWVADKHSTGGVGDKVSLVLGPVVAACGLPFAKMSGRGLGHTGTDLDVAEFERTVGSAGMAIIGQTPSLVPADKQLYALRDATATVEQEALIAASIMSKKIAGGSTCIVLDVKVGEGAFTPDLEAGERLARLMLELGRTHNRSVRCVLSRMDEPLGLAVGNALEVREAMKLLAGDGPPDVREVAFTLAGHLLQMSGLVSTLEAGRVAAAGALDSGEAQAACRRWIAAQGGDPTVVDGRGLPDAPIVTPVVSVGAGVVQTIRARGIAQACLLLGAGRATKTDVIDPAVGVTLTVRRGDSVSPGDILAHVHARTTDTAAVAVTRVGDAIVLGEEPVRAEALILAELDEGGSRL